MLDSLRDYSGSDRIGDGEFYVPSDGYSLKLILEISSEVSEGYSEQFSQERTGQFQTFIRIVVLVVGSPTSEIRATCTEIHGPTFQCVPIEATEGSTGCTPRVR